MQIKDVFKKEQFEITKIKYEYNSPTKDIIIKINKKEYEVKYSVLKRFLQEFNINLDKEFLINTFPIEHLDNRPLYKKSIDMQLDKKVTFNNQKHYISISYEFLQRNLGGLKNGKN